MDALLSVREVADALGVHPETIRRLIHDGRLDAIRVGRVLRIDRSELDRFIASQRVRPNPPGRRVSAFVSRARSPLGTSIARLLDPTLDPIELLEEDGLETMLQEVERRLEPSQLPALASTQLEPLTRLPRRAMQLLSRAETGTLKGAALPVGRESPCDRDRDRCAARLVGVDGARRPLPFAGRLRQLGAARALPALKDRPHPRRTVGS